MYTLIKSIHFDLLKHIEPSIDEIQEDTNFGPRNTSEVDLNLCISREKLGEKPLGGNFNTYTEYINKTPDQLPEFEKIKIADAKYRIKSAKLCESFINQFISSQILNTSKDYEGIMNREEQYIFTNLGRNNRKQVLDSVKRAGYYHIEKKLDNLTTHSNRPDSGNSDIINLHNSRYSVHLQNIRQSMQHEIIKKLERCTENFALVYFPHCLSPKLFQELLHLKQAFAAQAIFYDTVTTQGIPLKSLNENTFKSTKHIERLLFMCKKQVNIREKLAVSASETTVQLLLPSFLSMQEGLFMESELRASIMMHIYVKAFKLQTDEVVELKKILEMDKFKELTNAFDIIYRILENSWHLQERNGLFITWDRIMCISVVVEIYNMSVPTSKQIKLKRCDNPKRIMRYKETDKSIFDLEQMTMYLCFGMLYIVSINKMNILKSRCIFSLLENLCLLEEIE